MRLLFTFLILGLLQFTSPTAQANDVRALVEKLEARAMTGGSKAAYKLGLLWSQGKKVDPDLYSAAQWFERSAEGGYVKGMLKIGELYAKGEGVTRDFDKANFWNEKAADEGATDAMVKLGEIKALQNDMEGSANWYRKAAIKGNGTAQRILGQYYLKGQGVAFNLRDAFAWLELATQGKDREAKAYLNKIIETKGTDWADQVRNDIENRRVPITYWNAR